MTDAAAVQAAVDEVVSRTGRLDLMFNNAGIVWGGDTELITLDQWNAIIDVNIRGVVHGVAAAYPVMIRQGHGHIVNTASMAGLVRDGSADQLCDDQARRRRAVAGTAIRSGRSRGRACWWSAPVRSRRRFWTRARWVISRAAASFSPGRASRTATIPTCWPATLHAIERNRAHTCRPEDSRTRAGCSPGWRQISCSACRSG